MEAFIKPRKLRAEATNLLKELEIDFRLSRDGMPWFGWAISIPGLKGFNTTAWIRSSLYFRLLKDLIMIFSRPLIN